MNNTAFIDGQNLHMGTKYAENPWKIDFSRFRVYLKEKYKVEKAYYFIGHINNNHNFYEEVQSAGFVLIFKPHNSLMIGKKKGNIDTDLVFKIMKDLYLNKILNQIVLVSGDGDYKNLVDFLISEKKLLKIIFPNSKFYSSLYKKLNERYYAFLDNRDVKTKIKKTP